MNASFFNPILFQYLFIDYIEFSYAESRRGDIL